MWKLFNQGKQYTEEGITWMFWTPLGMKRSQIVYRGIDPLPATRYSPLTGGDVHYSRLFGKWYLIKGKLSLKEFYWQLGAGLIVSYLVYHFEVITVIYKLILGIL